VRQDVGISLQLHTIGESPMTLCRVPETVRPTGGSKTCRFRQLSRQVNLVKFLEYSCIENMTTIQEIASSKATCQLAQKAAKSY